MGCTPAVQNAFWFPLVAGSSRRGPRGPHPSPLPREGQLGPEPGEGFGGGGSLACAEPGVLRVTGSLSRWERAGVRVSQFGLKAQPGVLRVTGSLSRWERAGVRVSQFGLGTAWVLCVTGSLSVGRGLGEGEPVWPARTAWGATRYWLAYLSPPCEGGARGGGPHSLRIVSVFAVRP